MDKISVIVPTFNAGDTLSRCLWSLLNQTTPLHEILVVDDGSTDRSAIIAHHLAVAHPRIKLLRQANAGVSAARNTGLEAATGEFIGFVDPDDSVDQTMYERMINQAREHDLSVVALREATIRSNCPMAGSGAGSDDRIAAKEAIAGLLTLTYPSGVCAHLYSRKLIGETRFDTRIGFFEDLLFNFEILRRAEHIGLIAGKLYHYFPNITGANLSALNEKHLTSFLVCARLREYLVRDQLPLWGNLAQLESTCLRVVVYKAAAAEYRRPDLEERIRPFSRSILSEVCIASGLSFPTKALVIAASVAAGPVVGLARFAIKLKRVLVLMGRLN